MIIWMFFTQKLYVTFDHDFGKVLFCVAVEALFDGFLIALINGLVTSWK